MKHNHYLFVLILLKSMIWGASEAQAARVPRCENLFASVSVATSKAPQTSRSAADHSALRELAALRLHLDQKLASGEMTMAVRTMQAHYQEKQKQLLAYFEKQHGLSQAEVVGLLKNEILKQQGVIIQDRKQKDIEDKRAQEAERKQKMLEEAALFPGRRAIFNSLPTGTTTERFRVVKISRPFEMMATHTTQKIWSDVIDLANQKLASPLNIPRNPSRWEGERRPVESISWNDVQMWIKALNELAAQGEPQLAEIIPDFKKGDVYDLPTSGQWEYVARSLDPSNQERFSFGSDDSQLQRYAWHANNAGMETHNVAELEPLKINGQLYFDIQGNVWQMTSEKSNGEVKMRGGSHQAAPYGMRIEMTNMQAPDYVSDTAGFRLIRYRQ